MTPTALLLLAAVVAAVRSRRVPGLVPAARALCTLLLLDVYHHACRPLLDAWRAGATLSSAAEVWALRLDAWILAGGWCAVVAWLILCTHDRRSYSRFERTRLVSDIPWPSLRKRLARNSGVESEERFIGHVPRHRQGRTRSTRGTGILIAHGIVAVHVARLWPAAWTPLMIAPRFAVGALAWWVSKKGRGPGFTQSHCQGLSPMSAHDARGRQCVVPPSLLIGQIIAACQVGAAAFLWSRWGDVRILSSACWAACAWVAWRA